MNFHKNIYILLTSKDQTNLLQIMFRFAILSALIASVRADIPADSAMGRNLLSKARRVANNGGNNYNSDMTWMADYSIKCM